MFQVRKPSRRWVRSFALSTAVAFAALMVWALAMPMYGSPDEEDHMVKAYAVVHLVKGHYWDAYGKNVFRVPSIYITGAPCYAFNPNRDASCLKLDTAHAFHRLPTSAEAYPPFFYILVGWPTLVSSGLLSLYLMRGAGALVVALLIALALQNLRRVKLPGPLVLGVAAAITPAVFFFGATVNPSGIAAAAGLAIWLGGLVLARGDRIDNMTLAVSRVGAPLCVLLLLRRDSVYWAAMIVLSLVLLTPLARWRQLIRCRAAWAWAAAATVCTLLQLLFWGGQYGYSEFISPGVSSNGGNFWGAVSSAEGIAHAIMGGTLGWLDVQLPFPVLYIFVVSTGFLVVWALGFATKRVALTLAAMTTMAIAAPLVVGSFRYPYFQGRYMLPLTVGLPVVAAIGLAEVLDARFWRQRFLLILFPMLWFAQVFSLAQTLRRFTSGAERNWWFFTNPKWEPPMASPTVLLALFAIVAIAFYLRVYSFSLQPLGQQHSVGPSGPNRGHRLAKAVAQQTVTGLALPQPAFEPAPAGIETHSGAYANVHLFDQDLADAAPSNGADLESAERQKGKI